MKIDAFRTHLVYAHAIALLLVPAGVIAQTPQPYQQVFIIDGLSSDGAMTSGLVSSVIITVSGTESFDQTTTLQILPGQSVRFTGVVSDNSIFGTFNSFLLDGESSVARTMPLSLNAHYTTHLYTAHLANSIFDSSSFANTNHFLHSLGKRESLFSTPTGWIRDGYTVTGAPDNVATAFQSTPATLTGCFGLAAAVGNLGRRRNACY